MKIKGTQTTEVFLDVDIDTFISTMFGFCRFNPYDFIIREKIFTLRSTYCGDVKEEISSTPGKVKVLEALHVVADAIREEEKLRHKYFPERQEGHLHW